jgi:hypothetical protein
MTSNARAGAKVNRFVNVADLPSRNKGHEIAFFFTDYIALGLAVTQNTCFSLAFFNSRPV